MIEFQNVNKKFGPDVTALENINFLIEKGSFVFLVGSTGSGKTTIFRLIIRDLLPTDGNIVLGEWNLPKLPKGKIPHLRRKVGSIFQDLKLLMDRTVIENVMLPLEFTGVNSKESKARAIQALADVGLSGKEDKFPLQLSGGERQRVAIARALVFEPEVLLADEPTGNLDLATSLQILELLNEINEKRGTTIFMATHNEDIIRKTHRRVIMLEKGKLIEDKKAKTSAAKSSEEKTEEKEKPSKKEEKEKVEKEK